MRAPVAPVWRGEKNVKEAPDLFSSRRVPTKAFIRRRSVNAANVSELIFYSR
jgi:hypothetical protein